MSESQHHDHEEHYHDGGPHHFHDPHNGEPIYHAHGEDFDWENFQPPIPIVETGQERAEPS